MIVVRKAAAADAESVTDLWQALLAEQHELDRRFKASNDARERFLNDFPEWVEAHEVRHVVVAEMDGDLVGFASAQLWWPPPVYEQILEGDSDEERAWAISHMLRYAQWDDIWLYVSRDEVRRIFPTLDLPENLRQAWARMLKIEAPVGS